MNYRLPLDGENVSATPRTENPHVDPQRPPARPKHPHQQIWSAATDRLGHGSERAGFNQWRASFSTPADSCRDEKETLRAAGLRGTGMKERIDPADKPMVKFCWRRPPQMFRSASDFHKPFSFGSTRSRSLLVDINCGASNQP